MYVSYSVVPRHDALTRTHFPDRRLPGAWHSNLLHQAFVRLNPLQDAYRYLEQRGLPVSDVSAKIYPLRETGAI